MKKSYWALIGIAVFLFAIVILFKNLPKPAPTSVIPAETSSSNHKLPDWLVHVHRPIDLSGEWFTPHTADYNIIFSSSSRTFIFNGLYAGEMNRQAPGSYSVDTGVVTLHFNDPNQKDIILYVGTDKLPMSTNYYLTNTDLGQYFIQATPITK